MPIKDKILLNLKNYKDNKRESNYNNKDSDKKVRIKEDNNIRIKKEKSHSQNKFRGDNQFNQESTDDYTSYKNTINRINPNNSNSINNFRSHSHLKIPRKESCEEFIYSKRNPNFVGEKNKNRILDTYNNIQQSKIFENLNDLNSYREQNYANNDSKFNENLSNNLNEEKNNNEYSQECDNQYINDHDNTNNYENNVQCKDDLKRSENNILNSKTSDMNISKENYFKMNTNIQNNYSRDYVNELKSLFLKEKNELLFKNNLIQNTLDKLKNSFSEQIQQMTYQIEESEKKHEFSLKALEENIESYYRTIILEKDSLIEELNLKISNILESNKCLSEKLNIVEIAYEDKSSKIEKIEFNYREKLEEKCREIIALENQLKEKEIFYNEKIKTEKNYVLDEYEKKLNDLCNSFDLEKNESNRIIQNLYEENLQLKESLSQIDQGYQSKIDELNEEIICHKQNLAVYRERRIELENEKNNLKELLDNSKKEIKLITSEIKLLEENNYALIKDNDDLNIQLGKLGKIVYGKSKNQKIKN